MCSLTNIIPRFLGIALPILAFPVDAQDRLECGDDVTFTDGNLLFRSNVWQRIGQGQQCLIENGWTWEWSNIGHVVQAYPSVVMGKSPWAEESTDPRFPVRIRDLQALEVLFDVNTEASGEFNTALDLWITDIGEDAGPENIRAEIMIWLVRGEMNPLGDSIGWRSVAGTDYELFVQDEDDEFYVAFVSEEEVLSGSVDVLALIDELTDEGMISPEWYIANVELGNEVIAGSGETVVNAYAARVVVQ